MANSNVTKSVPSNEKPRETPAEKFGLGAVAETAGDLAFKGNGMESLQPTSSSDSLDESNKNKITETRTPTLDPICNMVVDQRTALHVERDGKVFYFCSDHCRQAFLETIAGVKSESKSDGCCGGEASIS